MKKRLTFLISIIILCFAFSGCEKAPSGKWKETTILNIYGVSETVSSPSILEIDGDSIKYYFSENDEKPHFTGTFIDIGKPHSDLGSDRLNKYPELELTNSYCITLDEPAIYNYLEERFVFITTNDPNKIIFTDFNSERADYMIYEKQ